MDQFGFLLLYVTLYYVLLVFEKLPPPQPGESIQKQLTLSFLMTKIKRDTDHASSHLARLFYQTRNRRILCRRDTRR